MNTTLITALDYEGRGVARVDGKTLFVENALPQEIVQYAITQDKGNFAQAQAARILQSSPYRTVPFCPHNEKCGGCSLQHIEFSAQVAMKQRVFEEQLQRIGKVSPDVILPPIYGAARHYRSRTRLNIAIANGRVNLGYQAKSSHVVVNLDECAMLPKSVSGSLNIIRDALQTLHNSLPKIRLENVTINTDGKNTAICVVSNKTLPETFFAQLSGGLNKNKATKWQFWQQIGKNPAQLILPKNAPTLAYRLDEFDLTMPFQIGDFTQINQPMNEAMISRAIRLLQPHATEKIADLFCGLGNFSLPIAKSGATVIGIEGADFLTQRAMQNARANRIHNVQFRTADLFKITSQIIEKLGYFDKMLLDPPRAGAFALVQALHVPYLPRRIVYVSCNPATFARDAAVLVQKGYRFSSAGVMNMFAQTAHVEAIAVFDLD